MRSRWYLFMSVLASCLAATLHAAPTVVTVADYIEWEWQHELLHEDIPLAAGELTGLASASVEGPTGAIPSQSQVLSRHPDGSVATLRVYWFADVPAGGSVSYTITPGGAAPAGQSLVTRTDSVVQLRSQTAAGVVGMDLPAATFEPAWPTPVSEVETPIVSVLLPSGATLGPSRFDLPFSVLRRETTVLVDGPLISTVQVRYQFVEGWWTYDVTAIAGEPLLSVSERFDTGDSGQEGTTIDRFHTLPLAGTGYAPTKAWYTGSVQRPELYADLLHKTFAHEELVGQATQANWMSSATNASSLTPARGDELHRFQGWPSVIARIGCFDGVQSATDEIGLVVLDVEDWRHPQSIRLRVDADGGVAYHFPLQRYSQDWNTDGFGEGTPNYTGLTIGVPPSEVRRSYGIILRPAAADPVVAMEGAGDLARKHGAYSLQHTRTLILDLPDPMADAEWAETTSEAGEKALRIMRVALAMKRHFSHFATFSMAYHFGFSKHKLPAVKAVIDSPKDLTAADRQTLRRLVAFYAYDMNCLATFPYGMGFHLNNPNMTIMAVEARVKTSLLVPDHPMYRVWGERSRRILQDYLPRFSKPSGAPYENPHYTLGVTWSWGFEVNNLMVDNGIGDAFDTPLLRKSMRFAMNWLTPPDPRYNGYRVFLPVGNGSYQSAPRGFGEMATTYFKDRDPELAAIVQWAHSATNNPKVKGGEHLNIVPEEKAPELGSVVYDEYGAFFRHGYGTPHETYFHILAGSCDGHNEWETDQLSYSLYAKGFPINLDFGNGYFPMFGRPWLRNRVSFDMKIEQSERNPSGIDAQALGPASDYIRAYRVIDQLWDVKAEYPILDDKGRWTQEENLNRAPPRESIDIPKLTWYRQVLFLKDPDPKGPNYFVMREDFAGRAVKKTQLNLWFLANEMTKQGPFYHFDGQLGTDMDVFVNTPEVFEPHTDTYGHVNQPYVRLTGDNLKAYPNGKRREDQLLFRVEQPAGEGYLVVLYPRLKEDDPAATCTRLAESVVKVSTTYSEDTTFLAAFPFDYADDAVTYAGQASTIRRFPDGRVLLINHQGAATVTIAGLAGTVTGKGYFQVEWVDGKATATPLADDATVAVQ